MIGLDGKIFAIFRGITPGHSQTRTYYLSQLDQTLEDKATGCYINKRHWPRAIDSMSVDAITMVGSLFEIGGISRVLVLPNAVSISLSATEGSELWDLCEFRIITALKAVMHVPFPHKVLLIDLPDEVIDLYTFKPEVWIDRTEVVYDGTKGLQAGIV